MAKIAFILNSTASHLWRITPQMKYLHEDCNHQCVSLQVTHMTKEKADHLVDWADIVVFQMVGDPSLVRKAKKAGVKTVFECDDILTKVNKKHPMYKEMYGRQWFAWRNIFYQMVYEVDLMTVTNEQLKKRYRWLRPFKKIEVLPNYMDVKFWDRMSTKSKSDQVRLGWAGGMSHYEDLEFISPVIAKLTKEYPKLRMINVGYGGASTRDAFKKVNIGEDLFTGVSSEQREFVAGSRPELWPSKLAAQQFDIGIAPLLDTVFSRHKTPIKYLEYAINKTPGVFQKFLYKEYVKHGKTGFLAETPEEWEKYLKILIEDKDLRERMGEEAYKDVYRNYNLHDHFGKWERVYGELHPKNTSKSSPASGKD